MTRTTMLFVTAIVLKLTVSFTANAQTVNAPSEWPEWCKDCYKVHMLPTGPLASMAHAKDEAGNVVDIDGRLFTHLQKSADHEVSPEEQFSMSGDYYISKKLKNTVVDSAAVRKFGAVYQARKSGVSSVTARAEAPASRPTTVNPAIPAVSSGDSTKTNKATQELKTNRSNSNASVTPVISKEELEVLQKTMASLKERNVRMEKQLEVLRDEMAKNSHSPLAAPGVAASQGNVPPCKVWGPAERYTMPTGDFLLDLPEMVCQDEKIREAEAMRAITIANEQKEQEMAKIQKDSRKQGRIEAGSISGVVFFAVVVPLFFKNRRLAASRPPAKAAPNYLQPSATAASSVSTSPQQSFLPPSQSGKTAPESDFPEFTPFEDLTPVLKGLFRALAQAVDKDFDIYPDSTDCCLKCQVNARICCFNNDLEKVKEAINKEFTRNGLTVQVQASPLPIPNSSITILTLNCGHENVRAWPKEQARA